MLLMVLVRTVRGTRTVLKWIVSCRGGRECAVELR